MNYNIVYDIKNKKAQEKAEQLKEILESHTYNNKKFEYLFIIGGDGNFLKFAKKYLLEDIKIIFINAGTLGFYSYVRDLKKFKINDIFNDKNYSTLDLIKITNNQEEWLAINDFSLYSNYAINLSIYINNILLEKIKSNGVLIATPMGSTARNKSLQGPIVWPRNEVLIMNEIEPIHNIFYHSLLSPIVLSNKEEISIKFDSYKKYNFIIDGVVYEKTLEKDSIAVTGTKSVCKFLIKTDTKSWINKLNFAFKY